MRCIIISKYKSGDYCYIIDSDNKIKFCNIVKELKGEPSSCPVYQVQDTIDWRYIVIEQKYCADDEKTLKKIKRKATKAKK